MTTVKLLTGLSGPGRNSFYGEIVDLEDGEASRLIASGLAEPFSSPTSAKPTRHYPVETPDGIRTSFTFLGIPSSASGYMLAVSGLVTNSGFTQLGNVVTFDVAPGDYVELVAYY
jgi:hypothetical protein